MTSCGEIETMKRNASLEASGECTTSSFQNVMKCDVDIRVNFYANVVLSSSTSMFQEIGECMTMATVSVGSSASLSSGFFFSGLLRVRCFFFFLAAVGLRHLTNISPCSHVSCFFFFKK